MIQESVTIPLSIGYDRDETFYYLKQVNSIEEFNDFLNKNFEYGYVYDREKGSPKRSGRLNCNKYKTVDVETFAEYRIGTCWDYVNFEAWVFKNKFKFDNTSREKLKNNTFSLYYIQFEDKDGDNPSHTWLGYMKNSKVYSFESSWFTHRGIKEFDSEKEMIEYYWKEHKKFSEEKCPVYKGFVSKFKPFCMNLKYSEELNVVDYMNAIYKSGCVIKSDFKEVPVKLVLENELAEIDTTFLDTEYEILDESAKILTHTKIPFECELHRSYKYDKNGIDNLVYRKDGKRYRVRTEMLLFKDNKLFLYKRSEKHRGYYYSLPGGGINPNEYIEDAAVRETEEEALITPKNVRYTGNMVIIDFDHGIDYDGDVTFICIGEYDKKYNKYIKKIDRDIIKNGMFYELSEVKEILSGLHMKIVKEYLRR